MKWKFWHGDRLIDEGYDPEDVPEFGIHDDMYYLEWVDEYEDIDSSELEDYASNAELVIGK